MVVLHKYIQKIQSNRMSEQDLNELEEEIIFFAPL